jgi:NADPH:quinone reductase-like Zn-dependent oxidoreductase
MGNWWGTDTAPLPNTPGVDVVGKVYHIKEGATSKFNLHPRQTVLSLVKWGGNTRFMTIGPEKLVKVPEGLDPAQAACLPETYLTAFQVLHFGQVGAIRYRENSLTGKSVLIVGSMANNMGKAIIELALNGGAANIYATAKKKHWKTLITYGIMPLSPEPLDWILRLEGTIDLVLASNGGLREDVTAIHYRALSPTGHLILSGRRIVGNDISVGDWRGRRTQSPIVCSKNKALAKILNRTHSYDVYEQWERDLENCKKDLSHLVNLLQRGVVKPTVLDRIPLNKVPRAHELLESKRLSGFLVCEPWMRSKKRAVYV